MGLASVRTQDAGLHNPSCSSGCVSREGSSSTGAWRKQLGREVLSGGSSAVKHGTCRKGLQCSSTACREGSSRGRQHLEWQQRRTWHLQDVPPWGTLPGGSSTVRDGASWEWHCGKWHLEGAAPWESCATPVGDTPVRNTPVGDTLWGTLLWGTLL